MVIQQGDQYAIPIKIQLGATVITPQNCSDVRVKIDSKLISYNGGQGSLTYSTADRTWCFPLTEALSFKYSSRINIQVGVKIDEDYIYSPMQTIDIGTSIIKELWDGD